MEKITIEWVGGLEISDFDDFKGQDYGDDYGLYQVYGVHPVYGVNTLLYIGKAAQQTFETRLRQHSWLEKEPGKCILHVGRLQGVKRPSVEQWTQEIDRAEAALIHYHSPAYNSQHIQTIDQRKAVLVHNTGERGLLNKAVFFESWENKGLLKTYSY